MRARGTPAIALAVALACAGCPGRNGPKTGGAAVHEPPLLQIYFMAQCPYSAAFLQDLPGIVAMMEGKVRIELIALVGKTDQGEIVAKNGPAELMGDTIIMCAAAHSPSAKATAAVAACMSKNRTTIPLGWEDCTADTGIPLGPLKTCILTGEGQEMLETSYKATMIEEVPVSPWVVIGGLPYNLSLAPRSVADALCCATQEAHKPKTCPVGDACFNAPVGVTVITDDRCIDCTEQIEEVLANLAVPFPALVVEVVRWDEPQAPELLASSGVGVLPALLLHEDVVLSAGWPAVEPLTTASGGYHVLSPDVMGASFDPGAEICDNGQDDTGDGLADCLDPGCAMSLPCRQEQPATLDLFVMSQCPFGNDALFAAYDVVHHFGEALTLRVHWLTSPEKARNLPDGVLDDFCVTSGETALCAGHGASEVLENLNQACVQALYPIGTFMDYARCMTALGQMNWKECALAADVDTKKVSGCTAGEQGFDLLVADAGLADTLGVDASPTWLVNNIHLESILSTPGDIADALCNHNPGLARCDDVEELPRTDPLSGSASGQCED